MPKINIKTVYDIEQMLLKMCSIMNLHDVIVIYDQLQVLVGYAHLRV